MEYQKQQLPLLFAPKRRCFQQNSTFSWLTDHLKKGKSWNFACFWHLLVKIARTNDSNSIHLNSKSIDLELKSIDLNSISIHLDLKSIDFDLKSIYFHSNSIDLDSRSLHLDSKSMDLESISICFDLR